MTKFWDSFDKIFDGFNDLMRDLPSLVQSGVSGFENDPNTFYDHSVVSDHDIFSRKESGGVWTTRYSSADIGQRKIKCNLTNNHGHIVLNGAVRSLRVNGKLVELNSKSMSFLNSDLVKDVTITSNNGDYVIEGFLRSLMINGMDCLCE